MGPGRDDIAASFVDFDTFAQLRRQRRWVQGLEQIGRLIGAVSAVLLIGIVLGRR